MPVFRLLQRRILRDGSGEDPKDRPPRSSNIPRQEMELDDFASSSFQTIRGEQDMRNDENASGSPQIKRSSKIRRLYDSAKELACLSLRPSNTQGAAQLDRAKTKPIAYVPMHAGLDFYDTALPAYLNCSPVMTLENDHLPEVPGPLSRPISPFTLEPLSERDEGGEDDFPMGAQSHYHRGERAQQRSAMIPSPELEASSSSSSNPTLRDSRLYQDQYAQFYDFLRDSIGTDPVLRAHIWESVMREGMQTLRQGYPSIQLPSRTKGLSTHSRSSNAAGRRPPAWAQTLSDYFKPEMPVTTTHQLKQAMGKRVL
ncbi:hypothetical protein F5Y16DRAFT_405180 [Xylariaceae sp. FL0255]|nr:hypothetical protein F5Y16DRAFT_405180 [Xylariaceae sp. FL0255]